MSERTAVYRIYDTADVLLYVGISKNFGTRWKQHAGVQPWWPDIHRQTVEWYPDRDAAHAAEVAAIEAENPRFNVMYAPHTKKKLRAKRPPPAPARPKPDPAEVARHDEIRRELIEAQANFIQVRDEMRQRRQDAVMRALARGNSKYAIAKAMDVLPPVVDSIIITATRERPAQSEGR